MSGIRLSAALACAFIGCATGEPPGGNNGGVDAPVGGNIDAPVGGNVDAPGTPIDAAGGGIDAGLQTITLSQNSSTAIVALSTVSCNQTPDGVTRQNSYYRLFRLSDFGVVRPFTAQRIDFGVEAANAGIGTTQTVQVRLSTLTGAFITTNLTNVAGQNVSVNDVTGAGIVIPVALSPQPVIQPGATLVAEVQVPDGVAAGNIFFAGSNAAAETGPSYVKAVDCAITEPQTMLAIGFPDVHIVLTVTGVF